MQAVGERPCSTATGASRTETGDAGRMGHGTPTQVGGRGDAGEEEGGAGGGDTGEEFDVSFPLRVGRRRGFDEVNGAEDVVGHCSEDGADEGGAGAAVEDSVGAAATAGGCTAEAEEEGGGEGMADHIS